MTRALLSAFTTEPQSLLLFGTSFFALSSLVRRTIGALTMPHSADARTPVDARLSRA
jgi:hypothetical protein